eukprot:COSAG03_NODE_1911_length_3365_cov_10.347214_2_plen_82_part_00
MYGAVVWVWSAVASNSQTALGRTCRGTERLTSSLNQHAVHVRDSVCVCVCVCVCVLLALSLSTPLLRACSLRRLHWLRGAS